MDLIEKRAKAFSELKVIRDKIGDDIGHYYLERINALKETYTIFIENKKDLLIWTLESNYPAFHKKIDHPENIKIAGEYFLIFVRHLHNTLASIVTYRDHSRIVFRQITNAKPKYYSEYQSRIKLTFARDPMSQYLFNLRNFLLHYDMLSFFLHFHYDFREGMDSNIVIDTAKLKRWDGWNKLARQYINRIDFEGISIQDQIESMDQKFRDLFDWNKERFEEHYKGELSTTEHLYNEHRRLVDIAYEEHVRNFGPTAEMKIPRSKRGASINTAIYTMSQPPYTR